MDILVQMGRIECYVNDCQNVEFMENKNRLRFSVTLKSQFQFETSVSVFKHIVAVNPLCISCLITWSGQISASNTWTFVYFF